MALGRCKPGMRTAKGQLALVIALCVFARSGGAGDLCLMSEGLNEGERRNVNGVHPPSPTSPPYCKVLLLDSLTHNGLAVLKTFWIKLTPTDRDITTFQLIKVIIDA